jgi:ketosteroid isomerase-like protein
MTILESTQTLHDMLAQGQLLEAFDRFYHQDVVMTEPRGTRHGKADCRSYEEQFLAMVEQVHGLEIKALAVDEARGKAAIESAMDVTFKDGNRVTMEQVAVQTWKDGQIVHERFYYDNAGA